ncbi:MAG: lanthionine synthetase LanC family protein [Bacteroidota bacterium]
MLDWAPIFRNNYLEASIRGRIDKIAEVLKNEYKNENQFGFISGIGGILAFMHQYNNFKGKLYFDVEIDILIKKYFDFLNDCNSEKSFAHCSGVVGIVWSFKYFKEVQLIDEEIYNQILSLEKSSRAYLDWCEKQGNYDYLYGSIVRYTSYFSEGIDIDKLLTNCADKMRVNGFGSLSITRTFGKPSNENYDTFDLGIAHGNCGVLLCLNKLYERNRDNRIKNIISELLKIFEAILINNNKTGFSFFPYVINDNETQIKCNSRLAWCTGDLAISYSLYEVTKQTGNFKLNREILGILLVLCTRYKDEETGVVDAGFCHGSSGVAYIFLKLYNSTKIDDFKKAATYWTLKTLEYGGNDSNGYAGYLSKHAETWEKSLNLITGISGIGLSLIATVDYNKPNWDKAFLLS